jgi:hypothetical protein
MSTDKPVNRPRKRKSASEDTPALPKSPAPAKRKTHSLNGTAAAPLSRPTQLNGQAASKMAPAPKPTTIHATIDVGFGNCLFVRGEGDGLSWDKGIPLDCVAPSDWVWSTEKAGPKLVFKLLLNDETWSQGEDWTVLAGEEIEVVPRF